MIRIHSKRSRPMQMLRLLSFRAILLSALSLAYLIQMSGSNTVQARQIEQISTSLKFRKKVPKPGDPFSITIIPKEKSFIFLFYIDDKDRAVSLYPGQAANYEIISRDDPLVVDSITNNAIKINTKKGKLITVAIRFSKQGRKVKELVLKKSDFSKEKPLKHRLSLTGNQLIERLEFMRADYPRIFHYLVEDAPQAMPQ